MNKCLLPVVALLCSKVIMAQTPDSAATRLITYAADKFPVTRTLNLELHSSGAYNFTAKLKNAASPSARTTQWLQTRASVNLNLIKSRRWILGTTFTYRGTSLAATLDKQAAVSNNSVDDHFHYHASSLNLTHISSLWGKRMIYSASLIVDGSDERFERVKALITANMILKSNDHTRIAVGIMGMIDPSTQLPVLPILTYEHHFQNGLIADITFPRNLFIRKNVFNNGRITLGTEVDRTSFYIYNADNSGKTYEFRQMDLNNGLIYEHMLFSHFIATVKGGIRITSASRIFDRKESFNDYIYDAKPDPSPYFSAGVSYTPFSKKKK